MSSIPYSSSQRNNVSAKMLQSRMIQTRRGITYNNSKSIHITQQILNRIPSTNKKLLMQLGKNSYESYFNRLYRSPSLNQQTKQSLLSMYQSILDDLSQDEQKELGILEIIEPLTQQQQEAALLQDPDFIFYCKMASIGTIKFFIILNMKSTYRFIPGKKYIFDLQDETNLGYQFSLSPLKYSYKDADGIDIIGTSGTPGAFVVLRPKEWFDNYNEQYSLYSYNKLDTMRSSYNLFPLFYPQLYLKLNYQTLEDSFYSSSAPFFYQSFEYDTNIECLTGSSFFKYSTYKGIKYFIEKEASYNENTTLGTYYSDKQYGLYYGTYTIHVQKWDPITIINKDKTNLIDISGDSSKMSVIYLNGLGTNITDTSLDGSYNFFYGDVQIIVAGNFNTCPVYSSQVGFNTMDNMFVFSSHCYKNAQARNHFQSITSNQIECLYPETRCRFDISNGLTYILFNDNTYYDSTKKYGLSEGQYILLDIPEEHPIAFINKGMESYFHYEGIESTGSVRLGPDDNEYTFYYGTIIIKIYGDFGNISLYDFYNGYAGGYQLFQYNDVCDYDGMWISDIGYQDTPYSTNIIESDISMIVYDVDSYIQFNYDMSYIYVSDAGTNEDIKYGLNIGNYVILDVPESHPIAFLNHGYENLFMYDGHVPYKVDGTGPDGSSYDFYYGNINIYITGNFGFVSFYVLNRGYLDGQNKFKFSSTSSGGFAQPNNGTFNLYPQLSYSIDDGIETFYIKVYLETIRLPYSRDIENFHFHGSDRNGIINVNESNPELTFLVGDNIRFAFMYANTSNTMGIYVYNQLIVDERLITFNNNNLNENIEWKPNISSQNYFYRSNSHELTFNRIQILPNNDANLSIDISNVVPGNGETNVSVFLDTFVFETTMLLYRSDYTKRIHLIDASNIILKSYDLIDTDVSSFSFSSNLSNTDRMEFDTTYSLIIDEGMFQNIYLEDFEDTTLTTFTTESIPNTNPVIILNGDNPISFYLGETYTEPGFAVVDFLGVDISDDVYVNGTIDSSVIGIYTLTYDVSDSYGNTATTVTRTVNVISSDPIITLVGDASMTVYQDDVYTEPGANATDDFDGDISNTVIITGTVDTSIIGTYTLAYDVSDSSGNEASTVMRTVNVISSITVQNLNQLSNNEVDIETTDTGNKYIFNDISYDTDKIIGLTNGDYVLENISDAHPIAILNGSESNISYSPVNDSPIIIKVSGGSFTAPYYTFSDENDNNISSDIFDGTFKFMRGRSYQFDANGISTSHPFVIFSNKGTTTSSSMTGSGSSITITMTNDDDESSYYTCANHAEMKGNLSFLYANAPDGNEYNFYYGNVNISVSGSFETISYYCFYHGYMGGENRLTYDSTL